MDKAEKKKITTALTIPGILLAIMWVIRITESLFHINLGFLGVHPLHADGIPGILLYPFIHGSFKHLMANSIPFLILGAALFYFYGKIAFKVFVSKGKGQQDAKFIKLFNLIDKYEDYDEARILEAEKSIKPSQISNLKAHYFGTANSMVLNFNKIDYFITGIGSGGTITGVGKRLKEEYGAKVIGVLPKGYKIGDTHFSHNIFGIGIGIKPKILDLSIIDDFIYIEEYDLKEAMKIARREGLFLGISSLANIAAIKKLISSLEKTSLNNATIITVASDEGDNYLSFLKELCDG